MECPPVTTSVPPTVTLVMLAMELVMMHPFVMPMATKPTTKSQNAALLRSGFHPTDTVTGASGERSALACSVCPAP